MNGLFRFMVLIIAILLTVGCAPSHNRRSQGPPLSDAMKKASNKHHGERTVTAPPQPFQRSLPNPLLATHHTGPTTSESATPSHDESNEAPPPAIIGTAVEYGIIDGDDFNRMYRFELFVGPDRIENSRFEGFIGGGSIITDERSELNQSVKDVWLLDIGARYKWFTTPKEAPMAHFFSAGFAYNILLWSYENNIERDGQTIGGDSLFGMEIFAGTGLNLVQTDDVQVGIEVVPSLMFWDEGTNQGFRNDVFGPMFTIKFRMTFGF